MDTPNTPPPVAVEADSPSTVALYVPAPGYERRSRFEPASLIVGTPRRPGQVLVDYEGDKHRRVTEQDPPGDVAVSRLVRAAARHIEQAPTVAREVLPEGAVAHVATWRLAVNELDVHDDAAFSAWLQPLSLSATQLARVVASSAVAAKSARAMLETTWRIGTGRR